jgi:hypothetical protein
MSRDFIRRRRYDLKQERSVLYIYSEGKVTEYNYFNAIKRELRLTQVNIVPIGTGYNTTSLIAYIVANCNLEDDKTECWAVFDKDSFPNFNEAIELGTKHRIKIAYSNEAFELWFILHFSFSSSPLGRAKLLHKLTKELGQEYTKNMDIYPLLKSREGTAIKNAKDLEKFHDSLGITSFKARVPSTTVFKLVERLRNL